MRPLLSSLSLLALVSLAGPAFAEGPPPTRTHGGLTVTEPPAARTEDPRGRIASDTEGSLVANEARRWVGPSVPSYVPVGFDDLELIELIPSEAGHLARYRQMYGRADAPGCAVDNMWDNCKQGARFYKKDGALAWEVDFTALFPRKTHLTVNHVLLADGVLYYGEACQTYAKDAGGQCSNVVALDVEGGTPKLLWRSKPLVSNAPILEVGGWLITGYGFTAEKDKLHILDRNSGKVVGTTPVKKAPEVLTLVGDRLEVLLYDAAEPIAFKWVWGTKIARPKLVPVK